MRAEGTRSSVEGFRPAVVHASASMPPVRRSPSREWLATDGCGKPAPPERQTGNE